MRRLRVAGRLSSRCMVEGGVLEPSDAETAALAAAIRDRLASDSVAGTDLT